MQTQSTLSGILVAQPARGLDYVVYTNRQARKWAQVFGMWSISQQCKFLWEAVEDTFHSCVSPLIWMLKPLGFMMLLSTSTSSTSTVAGGQWRRGEMRHSQLRGHCVSLDALHFIVMNLSHALCKHYWVLLSSALSHLSYQCVWDKVRIMDSDQGVQIMTTFSCLGKNWSLVRCSKQNSYQCPSFGDPLLKQRKSTCH